MEKKEFDALTENLIVLSERTPKNVMQAAAKMSENTRYKTVRKLFAGNAVSPNALFSEINEEICNTEEDQTPFREFLIWTIREEKIASLVSSLNNNLSELMETARDSHFDAQNIDQLLNHLHLSTQGKFDPTKEPSPLKPKKAHP